MKKWDNVILKEEVEELAKRGIHKDCRGLIIKIDNEICTVCFFNPYNFGENIYAKVNQRFLKFSSRSEERIIQEMEEHFPNVKMDFNKCFTVCDVKEYDVVQLIVEKPQYSMEGVHKGAYGCVQFPYAIDGKWCILFSNVGENNDRDEEVCVAREDFIIIE